MSSTEATYRFEQRKDFPGGTFPMVDVYVNQGNIPFNKDWSNRKCTMTAFYQENIEKVLNFKGRKDDVWVATVPKCGTTWMQETAWLVYNDFDFETAKTVPLKDRSPFVEMSATMPTPPNKPSTLEDAENLKSPRLLKTHLPASLFPTDIWKKKAKIIYVARNLKDAVVSFYHFAVGLGSFKGTKEEFVQAFMNDDLFFIPYWPHILEFYHMRNEPNIFFTSYERMKKDLKGVIKELCVFLDKRIPSEDILDKAVEHLSFDSMKNSAAGQALQKEMEEVKEMTQVKNDFQFMRRGVVGSYKDELSEELAKKLDQWSAKYLKEANATNESVFGL